MSPLILSLIYGGCVVGLFLALRAHRDLFSPQALFIGGFGTLYLLGIVGWAIEVDGRVGLTSAPVLAIVTIVVALVAFSAISGKSPRVLGVQDEAKQAIHLFWADLTAMGYVCLAVMAFLALMLIVGGPAEYVVRYEELRLESLTGWALSLDVFVQSGNIGFAIWLAYRLNRSKFSLLSAAPLAALIAVIDLAFSRTALLQFVLLTTMVLHYLHRPLRLRTAALIVGVGTSFFAAIGLYRVMTFLESFNGDALDGARLAGLFLRQFDAFDSLVHLFDDYAGWTLQWGATAVLPLLTKPIPRTAWPDKPEGTSHWLMDFLDPGWEESGLNRASGLLIEQFVNYHIVGVVLGMMLLAAIWVHLYRRMRRVRTVESVLLYAVHSMFFLLLLRNDINSVALKYAAAIAMTHIGIGVAQLGLLSSRSTVTIR